MPDASLPRTDFGAFTASRLCFGTLTMSPLQANFTLQQGADLIIHAHQMGVDFVDTADLYDTYPHIALALKHCPGLRVSTKCYAYDEPTARAALERAFAIGRERIDVMMLHEQESEHTLRGHRRALDFFREQQAKGIIGCVGISTHRVAGVLAAAKARLDIVHPILNMRGLGIQDGSLADMERACQTARDAGVRVLGMKALGGGHLIAQAQEAMAWAWSRPYLDAIAIGMKSADEIAWHVTVAGGKQPDRALAERTVGQPRHLLIHDWCEGCGACVVRCRHGALRLVDGRAVVDHNACVLCGYCAAVCKEFCIKVI